MSKEITDNAQEITINQRKLLSFQVITFPDDHAGLLIEHAVGYSDDDGKFIAIKPEPPIQIVGENFQKIMSIKLSDLTTENPDITLHEVLKTMLYDLLP